MKVTRCESSNVESYGYDEEKRELRVRFRNGSAYSYADVPPETHAELCEAESVGSFMSRNIAGQFETTKLDVEKPDGR